MQEILYGSLENVKIEKEKVHTSTDYFCAYDGIIDYLQKVMEDDESAAGKKWADQFISTIECPECHGLRLKKESLSFKIWDKNISGNGQSTSVNCAIGSKKWNSIYLR